MTKKPQPSKPIALPSKKGKTEVIQMGAYTQTLGTVTVDRGKEWVLYGMDNLFPLYLIDLYRKSADHHNLCTRIAFMIAGKGDIAHPFFSDELMNSTALDIKIQGGFYWEVILTNDGTSVAKVGHLPFENMRLNKVDGNNKLAGAWYSEDWADTRTNVPVFIPSYNSSVLTSPEMDEDGQIIHKRFVHFERIMTPGSMYYADPDYIGGIDYIELDYQIGMFHNNNIQNGLFPSIIIDFFNGDPGDEERARMVGHWENKLQGGKNAGKFIMNWNNAGDTKPEYNAFPITDADKQFEMLSRLSTDKILRAHGVISPIIFGIRDSSGFGNNADEMEIATNLMTLQVIRPYQRLIEHAMEVVSGEAITIEPNVPVFTKVNESIAAPITKELPGAAPTPTVAGEDVASQALNGAQIESLINIILQAASGAITVETARALVAAGFPMLTQEQIDGIFSSVVSGTLNPDEVVTASKVRSAVMLSLSAKMTDEDATSWIEHLRSVGEVIDTDVWELMHEADVTDAKGESAYHQMNLASDLHRLKFFSEYATADESSDWGDVGLYKLRYKYSGPVSGDTRSFCREMMSDSDVGTIYRYEDIAFMSSIGVNGQFAPQGQSRYDIFEWKGGVYCHHVWRRQIYFRKRGKNGAFLPNKGLENDKRVANNPFVPQKGMEGIAPINTPNRGSLKNT